MSDIFASQTATPAELAELYDLEHDEVIDDHAFWRELVRLHPGRVIDLGTGSGRLLRILLDAGAESLVAVDGSAALLERARRRVADDRVLAAALSTGRLELLDADVRRPLPGAVRGASFSLVVVAGVVPHLSGRDDLAGLLASARALLRSDGVAVLDDLGPAMLPVRDLPLSVDWTRQIGQERLVRRSALGLERRPDALVVAYSTLTERHRADGTIGSVPASFRLWYPEVRTIEEVAAKARLDVDVVWGSYDLDPYDPDDSERRIAVIRRAGA